MQLSVQRCVCHVVFYIYSSKEQRKPHFLNSAEAGACSRDPAAWNCPSADAAAALHSRVLAFFEEQASCERTVEEQRCMSLITQQLGSQAISQ
jgi:hypothetical protein